ncbi:hypothetical protein K7X08_024849 [Anisodus acutangulus]|uniref:Uncharacterized protein n=2 Tax=Anisodus TaxID=243963 RepID=A0A9Q1MBX8_9SOLA|nr:hypothetical protein K7X08_024849 [Anisodus acutangulus]
MSCSSKLLATVVSKKIIKPSSPTPSTHSLHKLSLVDQGFSNLFMPLAFFYPKKLVDTISGGPKQISELLENSLSKTLTCYYPWAGSSIDNATIHCNDNGAELLEVQINSTMDNVVNNPDSSIKDSVFPQGLSWRDYADGALTVAQLSRFDCGGIAISACLSHQVGDACSALFFFKNWAALTHQDPINSQVLSPYFVRDSLTPSSLSDGPLDYPLIV